MRRLVRDDAGHLGSITTRKGPSWAMTDFPRTEHTLKARHSDHEVFTLEEYVTAVDPTVAERTRYTNLQNAVARGSAYRVRRGLYASNLGVYRDRVPNVYLVATRAVEDAVLTHHSALEAHGVAHSPLRTVYFTSTTKMGDFEVRGYRFHRVARLRCQDPPLR